MVMYGEPVNGVYVDVCQNLIGGANNNRDASWRSKQCREGGGRAIPPTELLKRRYALQEPWKAVDPNIGIFSKHLLNENDACSQDHGNTRCGKVGGEVFLV